MLPVLPLVASLLLPRDVPDPIAVTDPGAAPGPDDAPAASPETATSPATPPTATSPSATSPATPSTSPSPSATSPAPVYGGELAPWAVGGFVDTQYIVDSNLPDNHIFRGTSVSSRTGEFSPNLIVAYIRRDPIRSPWMFELALQAGAAADALYATEPVAGGEHGRYAGVEVWKHIGRAWTGLKLRGGTEIAAGLMLAPTHFGSFWTKDNWHSTITWGYSSVPFFLAGVRVYQPIGARFGIGGWLANGYGTMGDANKAPSGLLNLVFTPRSTWALVQNVYAGPEDVDLRPAAWRVLLDTQVVYNTDAWGIAVVGDYGRERLTFKPGAPLAQWANGMASVRWHVLGTKHRWGMAARPEFFWERGGRIFNAPDRDDWLLAGTFTNDIRLWDALLLRVEYRYDRALTPHGFFYRGAATSDDGPGLAHQQHSLIFNIIGYFEHRFAGPRRP